MTSFSQIEQGGDPYDTFDHGFVCLVSEEEQASGVIDNNGGEGDPMLSTPFRLVARAVKVINNNYVTINQVRSSITVRVRVPQPYICRSSVLCC